MHAATNSESLGPPLHAVNRAPTTTAIARRDMFPSSSNMVSTSGLIRRGGRSASDDDKVNLVLEVVRQVGRLSFPIRALELAGLRVVLAHAAAERLSHAMDPLVCSGSTGRIDPLSGPRKPNH